MRLDFVRWMYAGCVLVLTSPVFAAKSLVEWQPFDAAAFDRARAEGKLLLLDLEAVWCHWCHVMDATTYVDARVVETLSKGFVAMKADHDARPDLANRYRNYGWPATVVFDANGNELAKRAGYIEPQEMITWLEQARSAPPLASPTDIVAGNLTPELRQTLELRHRASLDRNLGGLKGPQKFLDGDAVEYGLVRAAAGDEDEAEHVRKTLDAAMLLIDPVWGGAYQYSTGRVWSRPHFEKIMRTQARYLRIYALGHQKFPDDRYLRAIADIRRFMSAFLTSPQGTFYVSQDADAVPGEHAADYFALDDAARRRIGVPRVDTHVYAEANGLAIEALVQVHLATGNAEALAAARRAARIILSTHRRPDGSFSHSAADPTGFSYLADNLAMARAGIALFRATKDPNWLAVAQQCARHIDARFRAPVGYASGADNGTPVIAVPHIDENISLARFAAALHRIVGDPASQRIFDHALGYLTAPTVATRRLADPGILLADLEMHDPVALARFNPEHSRFDTVEADDR